MKATKSATTQPKPKTAPCSCGCQGSTGGACTCCKPICFERPNYFCGQLLSDADLTAEQVYVREKQKLYHRALHGYGVVCGLRLTCDTDCSGRIRIGDGYAIDNCGNDLVVCQPMPFDVIAALKAKNYLITEPPPDPCDDEERRRCKIKQCFYVTICYDEEESDFTTPFKTNCGPGAAACEPTRIRETVRFDILESPPRIRNVLDEIEERITCCWKVFTEGLLARALKDFLGKEGKREEGRRDYCTIFCQLKVLFQHHLKKCPDLYDCTLWEEVCQLQCPTDRREDYDCYQESFCKLFGLIRRYAYDCILGEMIFECPCPPKAQCIGLGSVEVEDGKLLRVCNCPRTYVWTFANFVEVFLATYVGGAACAPHHPREDMEAKIEDSDDEGRSSRGREKTRERECCATFEFDCRQFMDLFKERPDFGRLAAAAPIHAMRELSESLKTGFNFTDPLAFSPDIFKGLKAEHAERLARTLAGDHDSKTVLTIEEPGHHEAPDPITAIWRHLLKRPGDPLVATTTDNGRIEAAIPRLQVPGPLSQSRELGERLEAAEAKAAKAESLAEALGKQLDELRKLIGQGQQTTGAPASPAEPTKPLASGGEAH